MTHFIKYFIVLLVVTFGEGVIVHIEKIEQCEQEERAFTFGIKLKNDGDKQIIEEGYMDAKIDVNDDVINKVTIYTYDDDKWNFMIEKSDPVCTMVENFMGEFGKELESSAGLKTCPYAKGRYAVKNHPLDFSHFKYKKFPAGRVKLRSEFHPKDDENKKLGCYEVVFTLTQ